MERAGAPGTAVGKWLPYSSGKFPQGLCRAARAGDPAAKHPRVSQAGLTGRIFTEIQIRMRANYNFPCARTDHPFGSQTFDL